MIRHLYPQEILDHVRDEIEVNLRSSLGLVLCDTGTELSFVDVAPTNKLPAVLVDLVNDGPSLEDVPVGYVDVEYLIMVYFVRALSDGERPKEGLIGAMKAIRELFLRDRYDLPLLALPGHEIVSALPGVCEYGEPEELREPATWIEQAAFPLLVKARSRPTPS